MRGACGTNALCKTVLHRPRCSCPNCYVGRPSVECRPDPNCGPAITITSPRPADTTITSIGDRHHQCADDSECAQNQHCDRYGLCSDPCDDGALRCDENKKCETRRHRPVCVCKSGFVVNEFGELTCAPDKRECSRDDECASNMACIDLKCRNPCVVATGRPAPCSADKSCQVQDHKPICICMKDCSPSISICLRDSGCPAGLACRNYQCINPCDYASCAANSPCFVEDHKPICKFCPPGFAADARNGCQKGNKNICWTNPQKQKIHPVHIYKTGSVEFGASEMGAHCYCECNSCSALNSYAPKTLNHLLHISLFVCLFFHHL